MRSILTTVLMASVLVAPGQADDDADTTPDLKPEEALKTATNFYKLRRYDRALEMLEAHSRALRRPAYRNDALWLEVLCRERQGEWDKAKETLEMLRRRGDAANKARAEAHLAILKANPTGEFKGIVGKTAAEAMAAGGLGTDKGPFLLTDEKVFDAALGAWVIDLLDSTKPLIEEMKNHMEPDDSARAFEKAMSKRRLKITGDPKLPYDPQRRKIVDIFEQANAVKPDVARQYELELTRIEVDHVDKVLNFIERYIKRENPRLKTYKVDRDSLKMTHSSRKEWYEGSVRCARLLVAGAEIIRYAEKLMAAHGEDFAKKIEEYRLRRQRAMSAAEEMWDDRDRRYLTVDDRPED